MNATPAVTASTIVRPRSASWLLVSISVIATPTSRMASALPSASVRRLKRGGRRRGRRRARPWGRSRTRTRGRRARRSRMTSRLDTRITRAVAPSRRSSSAQTSKPVMSGSWTSRRRRPARARAPSRPRTRRRRASPTTSNPSDSSIARAEARKLGWSSTISTVRLMREIVADAARLRRVRLSRTSQANICS